jgi:hypothetical protein
MAGLFLRVGLAARVSLYVRQGLGDLAKEEAAAAAEMLEDEDAGAAGEEIFPKGGVEGGVDAVGDQDEVDIGIGEEGAALVGVGAADGVVVCRFVLVKEAKDDFEDLRIFSDDEDINGLGSGVGYWHGSA